MSTTSKPGRPRMLLPIVPAENPGHVRPAGNLQPESRLVLRRLLPGSVVLLAVRQRLEADRRPRRRGRRPRLARLDADVWPAAFPRLRRLAQEEGRPRRGR